jgi:hypothetical protein
MDGTSLRESRHRPDAAESDAGDCRCSRCSSGLGQQWTREYKRSAWYLGSAFGPLTRPFGATLSPARSSRAKAGEGNRTLAFVSA